MYSPLVLSKIYFKKKEGKQTATTNVLAALQANFCHC